MNIIDMRTQAGVVPENFNRAMTVLVDEIFADAKAVMNPDLKVVYRNNISDLTKAQTIVTANDSHIMYQVMENDFVDAQAEIVLKTDEPDISFEARVDAKKFEFNSNNMTVVKSIVTTNGRRRGYEVEGKILRPNFGANRYDMAS